MLLCKINYVFFLQTLTRFTEKIVLILKTHAKNIASFHSKDFIKKDTTVAVKKIILLLLCLFICSIFKTL